MECNIAVVGCGYWGKNLVRNFAELGALHTICDTREDVLRDLGSRYSSAHTERDYARVLADESIKGVVIASPAALHYEMAKAALEAGKDVFVEKPLALRIEEGQELVELAEQTGRVLLVGHLLEYHPAVIKLKELVDSGQLGRVQYVYSNRLNLGRFRTEENILWSFAPHDISVILLLLGGEMPQEVSAHGGSYLHRDIADVTLTHMNFRDGVRAHIFVSWLHPYKEHKLVVVGDQRMALFDDTREKEKLLLYSHHVEWIERRPVPRREEAAPVEVEVAEPLKLECEDFVECMGSRRQPRVDGHKGLQVLRVLSACQESLEQGGRIVFPGLRKADYYVHESSIVEEPCSIGAGTKVWHFSHVMPGASIGEGCTLGQNVFVGRRVSIGNGVKVENNVSVFEGVTLEDDVFCGPSCVFTNVNSPRSHISRKEQFQSTRVRKGATIGANATIVCGTTIGRYALVGAGSVVTKDIPPHAVAYGNPAAVQGWACRCGARLDFASGQETVCPSCGACYRRVDDDRVKACEGE